MPKITDLLDRLDGIMASASITAPIIPPVLIQCGVIARPGLSAIRMTQNIVKDLAAAGFPITEYDHIFRLQRLCEGYGGRIYKERRCTDPYRRWREVNNGRRTDNLSELWI